MPLIIRISSASWLPVLVKAYTIIRRINSQAKNNSSLRQKNRFSALKNSPALSSPSPITRLIIQ